jgi:teichuronic acid biosynthesis glycosyltransferase TuaC
MACILRNILFVIPAKRADSPQSMSFVKRLARGVQELGPHVHIFGVMKSANPILFWRQGFALRQAVRANAVELVVGQFGTYTGLLVALFAPRPKIITFRGSDLNPVPSQSLVWNILAHSASHIASQWADGIVVVSRELQERLLFKSRMIRIIQSPTDTELFQPRDILECRNLLGWAENSPSALFFVGSNSKVKGVDLAREVNAELVRRASGISFHIIEKEVPLADMPLFLNAADCLIFLSEFEGSPNLVRDACACNLPVVTVEVGDVAEVLAGVAPSKIVPRNVVALADALTEVCLARQRSNGRSKVMKYSTREIALCTLEFYSEVVAENVSR